LTLVSVGVACLEMVLYGCPEDLMLLFVAVGGKEVVSAQTLRIKGMKQVDVVVECLANLKFIELLA